MDENDSLLKGIRVLDFTHVLAGPFCTYQLAVMGADVIKIESPDCIDVMRFSGPQDHLARREMGLHYQSQSANKRAMTLDLTHADASQILDRLVADADVLVVNYRKKAAQRLLIDYERVKQLNPAIIYCSLTGFGLTGPKADDPAYDNVIQAFSGLMAATGTEEHGPVRVGPPVLDYGTGAQAALAVMGSLFRRERTGYGNFIDVAMLDAAMMLMSSAVTETACSSMPPVRPGNRSARASYGSYATLNGAIMIGAYTQKQIVSLWRALGLTDKADSVELLHRHELDDAYDEDSSMLADVFSNRKACEWEALLIAADVPAARVRTLDQSILEPQVQSRTVLQNIRINQGESAEEKTELAVPTAAWQSEFSTPKVLSAPPAVGEHTDEILTELGFSAKEIAEHCQPGGSSFRTFK